MTTTEDVPQIIDWTQAWGQTESAVATTYAHETNVLEFDIYARDTNDYMASGRMSTKKQIKNGITAYWWGYTVQLNFKQALRAGNIV